MKKVLLVFSFLILFSCNKPETTKQLKREDLFSLYYGNFENELNLSKMDRSSYSLVNFCLNNGIFYISNALGQKIIKTSFYGDLLSVYYNPKTNPRPHFYTESKPHAEKDEQNAGTRTAIEYPFKNCTFLQVNELEHLYVVDSVPNERIQFDSEENIALTNVILHFDEYGHFIDYIGQEGLGGTPFANIVSLSTNSKNEIIAVSKTLKSTKVFWFNCDGVLLSKIDLKNENLPFYYDKTEKFFMNIDGVFPSYEKDEIFLKIDYYVEHFDDITKASIGVNYDKSSIYKIALSEGVFEHVQDVLPFKDIANDEVTPIEKVYILLNVCKNDLAFLMVQTQNSYSVLVLDLNTGKNKRFNLELKSENLLYRTFYVTKDYMLAGLFATEDKVTFSVWKIQDFVN